jgi:nucleotide-binding universal stress UspA family protein
MAQLTPRPPSSFAIVVGLKFSEGGTYAFDQAARLARHIPSASIHLVHVFESSLSKEESVAMTQHLELYATEKAASLGGFPGRMTGIHLRTGDPAKAIVQLASEVDAELIVLGSEKHATKSWFTAPTAEKVIFAAPCPVLVAGPKPLEAASTEPVIEPPCADCVATRRSTGGQHWWCARHSEHARSIHTFSYQREFPFATHDSQLGPTG